jgi:O-antigen ligase
LKPTNLLNICSVLFSLFALYFFLFEYQYSYNFQVEINKHYAVLLVSLIGFSLFLFLYFFSSRPFYFNRIDFVFLMLLVWCLLFIICEIGQLNLYNEYFVCCLVFLMIYFMLRFSSTVVVQVYIPVLLTGFFVFELFEGLSQLLHFINHEDGAIAIKGSMVNSGIFSCYLVINLPIVVYVFAKTIVDRTTVSILSFLTAIAVITVLFFTQSRAAMIALIPLFFYLATKIHFTRFKKFVSSNVYKIFAAIVISLIIAFISYFTIHLKYNSYLGRVFVWKVSLSHLSDNMFFGVGSGNFAYYYPKWQIEYVRNDNYLDWDYLLNADETHVANNEYIQILAETGLTGFLSFSFIMLFLLLVQTNEANKRLQSSAKLTILTILSASFFTYALHCNAVSFVFIFCIVMLSPYTGRGNEILNRKARPVILSFAALQILVFALLIKTINMSYYIGTWSALNNDANLSPSRIKSEYQLLYPVLKKNGKFLVDYGEHLLTINEPAKAAQILEESKRYYLTVLT